MAKVTVEIEEKAFDFLSKWASVSRTLKNVHDCLEIFASGGIVDDGRLQIALDELPDLIGPLDEMNRACRNKVLELNIMKK